MPKQFVVDSMVHFLGQLDLAPESFGESPIYRGEPLRYSLPCEPKAFREDSSYRSTNALHLLDPIQTRVGSWVRDVMISEGKPLLTKTELEEMILAQHYGVATRLLDWTINPLAALWFAVTYHADSDGFVYLYQVQNEYLDLTRESYGSSDTSSDRRLALERNPYNREGEIGVDRFQYEKFTQIHFFRPSYLPDARVVVSLFISTTLFHIVMKWKG